VRAVWDYFVIKCHVNQTLERNGGKEEETNGCRSSQVSRK